MRTLSFLRWTVSAMALLRAAAAADFYRAPGGCNANVGVVVSVGGGRWF